MSSFELDLAGLSAPDTAKLLAAIRATFPSAVVHNRYWADYTINIPDKEEGQ